MEPLLSIGVGDLYFGQTISCAPRRDVRIEGWLRHLNAGSVAMRSAPKPLLSTAQRYT